MNKRNILKATIAMFVIFMLIFLFCIIIGVRNVKKSEKIIKDLNYSIMILETKQSEQIKKIEENIEKIIEKNLVEASARVEKKEIKLSFLGDCMMASYNGQNAYGNMNWYLDNYPFTYFFEDVIMYIGNDDFTIANCENVFTDTATTPINKDYSPAYWFRSAMKNAGVFSENSIEVVSIANNHVGDYGNKGREDTKKALEDAGVLWGNDDKAIILEKDGVKIGVLCVGFWVKGQANSIVNKINNIEKTTDIQIVFFHGGKEGTHTPENWKIEGCRAFVDAGADLVVGCHPHVIQPHEEYKGVDIIYSLGNFCYGGSRSPENRTIILQETFTFENNTFVSAKEEFIPCYVYTGKTNNWKPSPISNEDEKNVVLNFMYGRSNLPK